MNRKVTTTGITGVYRSYGQSSTRSLTFPGSRFSSERHPAEGMVLETDRGEGGHRRRDDPGRDTKVLVGPPPRV